ncbi:MAG: (2Fe-2S)-binding protein [Aestuariivita sp.]|nr:(2Fe-2S)-binding protein [Aestuariivita sp.]MCY4346417.1 (2Fe-2S)-binding protein [Aestuariivita sp.]
MSSKTHITLTINDEPYRADVEPRMLAADFLRDELALTGTHIGCEHGVCGACTILLNGVSVRSCLLLAIQLDDAEVQTVEGLGSTREMHRIQTAFREYHALQCGFCTPGFLMTVQDILNTLPLRNDKEIRDALSGNICRCTGYDHIVKAVRSLVTERDKIANQ